MIQMISLTNYVNLKFLKVSRFTTKKSIKDDLNLPIYLVQISNESSVHELKLIHGLLHRCIRWEALRKPEIPQCRRCQSFFHSASNCFLPARCVKCNESHDVGKCNQDKVSVTERDKLFCVLCNKYGHPASYRGCEKYVELQNRLRAKRQNLTQNINNRPSVLVNPNISYSNILQNNTLQNGDNNNPIHLALKEFTNSMHNLSNQILNLQKQLQIQTSRIDTIFTMFSS